MIQLPVFNSRVPWIPIEFRFHKDQKHPVSRVSDFLAVPVTELSATPVYFVKKRVEFRGAVYLAYYYSVFYAANPGYTISCLSCFPRFKNIGVHKADVERIVILLDEATETPKFVYFGAHGGGHGCWRDWDAAEKTNDGHLVVYVSCQSHGFYPSAGTWIRVFGLANDVTADHSRWRPQLADLQDANTQSWSSTHFQVSDGINGPQNAVDPTVNSISFCERLCLPFGLSRISKYPKYRVLNVYGALNQERTCKW